MNILKNKQNRSGIISLILLLLSFVLFVVNAITISSSGSATFVLLETLCLFLAFVFALIGIVRAIKNKKGFLICVPGLALPLLHFCVSFAVFFSEIRPLLNYTDEYVYDINKNKIEYRLGRGFLEYNRHDIFSWIPYIGADGNYYYTVYLSGLNGERLPLPYCYWLNLYEGNPMIGLSEFCDYYHYHNLRCCSNRLFNSYRHFRFIGFRYKLLRPELLLGTRTLRNHFHSDTDSASADRRNIFRRKQRCSQRYHLCSTKLCRQNLHFNPGKSELLLLKDNSNLQV